MQLVLFREKLLEEKLLKSQWWEKEKVEQTHNSPWTVLLHNTSIWQVIDMIKSLKEDEEE
jgi:hypothetical protein